MAMKTGCEQDECAKEDTPTESVDGLVAQWQQSSCRLKLERGMAAEWGDGTMGWSAKKKKRKKRVIDIPDE